MLKLGKVSPRLRSSPSLLAYGVLALSFFSFLYWRLSSLPAGLSNDEVLSRNASLHLHGLLTNPTDAPYHLLQHGLFSLHGGVFSLRLASVLVATLLVSVFFLHMRSLFGRMIGLLGSLLLLSLPFYAISARQATPQIMLFLPLLLMYGFYVFTKAEHKTVPCLLLALIVGISLYTPGILWWLVAAAALAYKKLAVSISKTSGLARGISAGLLALCITPLVVIAALHSQALKQLLLIPASWPSPMHFGSQILHMLSAVLFKSPGNSLLLLNDLPVLNITLIALAAFGGYALFMAAKDKAIPLGLSLILAVLLAAVKENVAYLALAVPALAIAVTAGLRYLYVEWRGIFPRNPVPKTFALILIALVTTAQVYFGISYCLHAWPHSPAVRNAYVLK